MRCCKFTYPKNGDQRLAVLLWNCALADHSGKVYGGNIGKN